jgi:hypothetical protein
VRGFLQYRTLTSCSLTSSLALCPIHFAAGRPTTTKDSTAASDAWTPRAGTFHPFLVPCTVSLIPVSPFLHAVLTTAATPVPHASHLISAIRIPRPIQPLRLRQPIPRGSHPHLQARRTDLGAKGG